MTGYSLYVSGEMIVATDLSRLPPKSMNTNNHFHHLHPQQHPSAKMGSHFEPTPPYKTSGTHDIDITSNGTGSPDLDTAYMRSNKLFMDLSYRSYCKSIQERGGNYPQQQQQHDYDEAIQSQSINSPAVDHHVSGADAAYQFHHHDTAEKANSKYAELYIKSFDSGGGSASIRPRQLDEMQSTTNCDTVVLSNSAHVGSIGASTAANTNAHSSNNNNNNTISSNSNSNNVNDDSSEARNYASSDEMNQTASSERDDKLGSGSEDEGKKLLLEYNQGIN